MYNDNPVFIVGIGRSGSKLLRRIIIDNSEIYLINEIHLRTPTTKDMFETTRNEIGDLNIDINVIKMVNGFYNNLFNGNFWEKMGSKINSEFLGKEVLLAKILESDRSLKSVFSILLEQSTIANGKDISGAKSPVHILYLDLLFKWFPNCKIIHLTREPRAVVSSYANRYRFLKILTKRLRLKKKPSAAKIGVMLYAILTYNIAARIHRKYVNHNNYYLMRFEDLIKSPKYEINRLEDFLGCSFRKDLLFPDFNSDSTYSSRHIISKENSYSFEYKKNLNISALINWKNHISKIEEYWIWKFTWKAARSFGY